MLTAGRGDDTDGKPLLILYRPIATVNYSPVKASIVPSSPLAGDADLDGDFDQRDLVKLLQADN